MDEKKGSPVADIVDKLCSAAQCNSEVAKVSTTANATTHTTPTTLDFWPLTPVAGGDDSDATAEAIATCAGIAPFNSLQG